MQLILASNNKNKLREISQMLAPLGVQVISQSEAGITLEVEETGTTFAENAALKARAISARTGKPVLADDSGLAVDALQGAPGVYSHRYAGENATDADRCAKLLRELADVPEAERTARFFCAMCYVADGEEHSFLGKVEGTIGYACEGDNGFGYDPVFRYQGRSFATLSAEEKNAVSHRADALRQVYAFMEERTEANGLLTGGNHVDK